MDADILAICVSIIALLYTIYVDYKTNKFNMRTTKESAMAVFFMKLYFDILTTELPELLNSFNSNGGKEEKIKILEKIDDTIVNILDRSLFYKYYDNDFYLKTKNKIVELQDLLFRISDCLDRGTYRADTYGTKLDLFISDLYKSMINYYSSI